uniref:HMA domain-containing protein n=1 Tax=Leersia perrieri TaxID=77586 RepID=A0A0D9W0R7_9ORYZ
MAPLLFKDMKSLSCSSPASTAICPSLERQPMVRSHRGAIVAASPLCQVPSEPRIHHHRQLQDCKRGGQQHKAAELVSPANSSRYLLSSRSAAAAEIQEVEASAAPVVAVDAKVREEQAGDAKNTQTQEQVVVLKVSLHCKACAGKVKKHLAKMEGVTSFNIDFAAKKVTVVGDVTPLGVLNSVSKVKNAQFWATPPVIAA